MKQARRRRKTWTKPKFEFVDLCCEVTLYLYHD
jgi:coenzyme PQQ precursor peptide PqqA